MKWRRFRARLFVKLLEFVRVMIEGSKFVMCRPVIEGGREESD